MKSITAFLFLFCVSLICVCIAATSTWELKKYNEGVAVYTRTTAASPIKEVRIVDTVKSSLSAIAALMFDTKNYPNWIYHCSAARTLKVISAHEEYKYELISVPWPFSDRDIVTDFKVTQDSATKVVTLTTAALPDYLPAISGVVRMTHFYSVYKLTPLANGLVRVEYELSVDPTGRIPAWLINANIVNGPYTTALATNKQLPKYQLLCYSFIREKSPAEYSP